MALQDAQEFLCFLLNALHEELIKLLKSDASSSCAAALASGGSATGGEEGCGEDVGAVEGTEANASGEGEEACAPGQDEEDGGWVEAGGGAIFLSCWL